MAKSFWKKRLVGADELDCQIISIFYANLFVSDIFDKKETHKFMRRSLKYLQNKKMEEEKFETLWSKFDFDDAGIIELREFI